jgi:hypothetical protein
MATARRLYLYTVSAIGLGLMLVAAGLLLKLFLGEIASPTQQPLFPGSGLTSVNSLRESLAQAIGLMAVGLPLWLVHWGLTERMVRGDEPAAQAERQSVVRSIYFAAVLGILLYVFLVTAFPVLEQLLDQLLDARDPYSSTDLSPYSAAAVVGGAAWAYHAWVRVRDVRLGSTIRSAAAWISRLYVYGAAIAGLLLALAATTAAIGVFVEAAAGHDTTNYYPAGPFGPSSAAWWVRPCVNAGVALFLGGLVWAGHMGYASRLRSRADEQGEQERTSRVQLAFFVGVVVLTVYQITVAFAQGLGLLLTQYSVGGSNWRGIATPPLGVAFLIVAWWAHRRYAAREQLATTGSAAAAVRPMDYGTSLAGLALVVAGLIGLLGILARLVVAQEGSYRFDMLRAQGPSLVALIAVGLPVWLWPRLAARRRRTLDPAAETCSSSRRYYLFFIVGVAVVAGSASLFAILSQILRAGLGLDTSGFGSAVRDPLVDMTVVVAVLALHVPILLSDLAFGVGAPGGYESAGPD